MKTIRYACIFASALSLAALSHFAAVVPAAHAQEVRSADPASAEAIALREEGIALHNRAVEGDADAAEAAVSHLERYLDRVPKDGEALAYLGSAYALMARDSANVINKTRYANRGVRHLDRALDAEPRMFTVRLVRARVNSSLPRMFGRGDDALADMLALDEIYGSSPSPRMAREMVGIYEELARRAPDAGPWDARLGEARELAGSR